MENLINLNDEQALLMRNASMEERIWVDSNVSKIDEILRVNYDKTVDEFAEIVLSAVADMIESIRGAFFVVDHEQETVKAVAGYACVVRKMLRTEFEIGEDLVGFAVKSKKMRVIEDLSHDDSVISSGLAHITSSCIIITPLIFNDIVYGVIELNQLKKIEPRYLELITRLSRNIASTLQSIQNNMHTVRLLDDLKQKTEEMISQEEELRQNIEEMSAIRDEMERKQRELEKNNERLNKSEVLMRAAIDSSRQKEQEVIGKEEQLQKKEAELQKLQEEINAIAGKAKDLDSITFQDLFDLDEIQRIQDDFAVATGVASIITELDGNPITKPSNFSYLCEHVIRCTDKGIANCMKSDAILGTKVKNGAAVQPCLSGGLWDGGTGIFIGEKQIANWLIGQVLTADTDETKFLKYAKKIGADEVEFKKGLASVTRMPIERFEKIADFLYIMAQQLSKYALQNYTQSQLIAERTK